MRFGSLTHLKASSAAAVVCAWRCLTPKSRTYGLSRWSRLGLIGTSRRPTRRSAQAGKVYREEAAAIGLPWKTARMNINLVDELPRLTFLRDTFHSTFGAFMASVWRQLSGFQHGKQYSLLSASTQGRSLPIPGGQSVYVTISDQNFVNLCKLVNALHQAALLQYTRRCTLA